MPTLNEIERARLQKRMMGTQMLSAPAAILLGIGLYAKFVPQAADLHPILGNDAAVVFMLTLGATIEIFCVCYTVNLLMKIAKLK